MIIKHKRTSTTGKVPTATDIQEGEIAINTKDVKLFIKDFDGVIQEIGSKSPISSELSGVGKQVSNIVVVTQAEYDAIGTGNYDNGTVYLIEA